MLNLGNLGSHPKFAQLSLVEMVEYVEITRPSGEPNRLDDDDDDDDDDDVEYDVMVTDDLNSSENTLKLIFAQPITRRTEGT